MKIYKQQAFRCSHIIQPGEFTISRWDGEQCSETKPHLLMQCPQCDQHFCLLFHWQDHDCTREFVASLHAMYNTDPVKPLGTCGVCDTLHNKCSRLDWKEEKPF